MIDAALGLYVHMPWCVRKCPYCDFNSHQLKSARPDAAYIDVLLEDFACEAPRLGDRRVDTVFFGGGTPSLFAPEAIARFLETMRQRIAFSEHVEITLEANPGTIERGRFSGYADAGINRVSLGAQTFSPAALDALGRIHTADDTLRSVEELRAAHIDNFNLDLMYALPQQSEAQAIEDVRIACSLEPVHISYYQLTLEVGTVFHSRPPALPDEEEAWRIQHAGQTILAEAGYVQYEVSAYARNGARCRHNLNYWLFGDYLGLGAGAHGKLSFAAPGRILRTIKPKQPRDYQDSIRLRSRQSDGAFRAEQGGELIATADLPFEFMLNALRLNDGFCRVDFERRTGLSIETVLPRLKEATRRGLIETHAQGWRPTELGFRFLNDLQGTFLN